MPYAFAVDDLETLLEASVEAGGVSPKAIVINAPHNPTGALISREDQTRLVELCERHGCYLFSDEMYGGGGGGGGGGTGKSRTPPRRESDNGRTKYLVGLVGS